MRENTFIIHLAKKKKIKERSGQCEEIKKPRYTRCISLSGRYCRYNLLLETYCR